MANEKTDIFALLKSDARDYVVNHGGDHIQVDSLKKPEQYLGVYFSAHW